MNFEKTLLSAILSEVAIYHSPDTINLIKNDLHPQMFENDIYRAIYEAMLAGDYEPQMIIHRLKNAFADIESVVFDLVSDSTSIGINIVDYARRMINDYASRNINGLLSSYNIDEHNVVDETKKLIDILQKSLPREKDSGITFEELANECEDKYFCEHPVGFELGLEDFDRNIGKIMGGDTVILAARPSVGKSAFSLQILLHNKQLKGGYFNLEMEKEQIFERLAARFSKIDMGHLIRAEEFLNNEEQKYREGLAKLRQYSNIRMFNGPKKVSEIRNIVDKEDFDFIIVDYLQIVIPDGLRSGQRYVEVGDMSRGFKSIAHDYHIPVIVLSQLNRVSEGRKDKEPSMAELRESGDIEQDASFVLIMWNDEKDETIKHLKAEKVRQGHHARANLLFNGANMEFKEIGADGYTPKAEYKEKTNKKDNDGFLKIGPNDEIPFI